MLQAPVSYRPKLAFQSSSSAEEPVLLDTTRQFQLNGDISHQASGSASCELGKTKVICQVYGPRPRKAQGKAEFEGRGAVDVDATFSSLCFPSTQQQETIAKANRELSLFLEDAVQSSVQLALFPKSVLDVSVLVLEDDGSAYACACICVSYALAKCGIEMFDLVSAVTLYLNDNGEVAVDPTRKQEAGAVAICTAALFANSGKVTALSLKNARGGLSADLVSSFLAKAQVVCTEIDKQMRAQLVAEDEEFIL